MALKMAQPWKDPKTGVCYLRQRVPSDLVKAVRGKRITLPIADRSVAVTIGEFVQVSLRTKDAREAKVHHAGADAALRRYWEACRAGPSRLTHKHVLALAGRYYRETVERHEDDPGCPQDWVEAGADALIARVARQRSTSPLSLGIMTDHGKTRLAQLNARYGEAVDDLLSREGLVVDAKSRIDLLREVAIAFEQAARQVRAYAEGDYQPNPEGQRFPAMPRPKQPEKPPAKGLTVAALFEAWKSFHVGKRARTTIRRYTGIFDSLSQMTKNRDVKVISGDDIFAWAKHRRDKDNVNPSTINGVDLVAISAVFNWAMSHEGGKQVASNPVKGIKLSEEKSKRTREPTFREDEIKAILNAALAVKHAPLNRTLSDAKRWTPWLAAYSGARISELTALTGEDIRLEAGIPVMSFKDTKTDQPRTVPIHAHLVEQGFMDFAKAAGSKPLFYDPRRHKEESETSPWELRSRTLSKWVRTVTHLDDELSPNHGWRHTWKSIALDADIDVKLRDAIAGHADGDVARGYETPGIKTLARAMAKFPRYDVGSNPGCT